MGAKVLDGKWVREQILAELRPRIERLTASHRQSGFGGNSSGTRSRVGDLCAEKIKTCGELGIYSEKITPPDTISTEDLLDIIEGLNQRKEIDGILVQSPLPKQVDKRRILLGMQPDKDVDGFHPLNVGSLVADIPAPRACTPAGIMELLRRYEIPITGKHAVVVGRSDIVGKPMALLLLHQSATVTICHSKTSNLAAECRRGDILVAAIGRPAFLTRSSSSPAPP